MPTIAAKRTELLIAMSPNPGRRFSAPIRNRSRHCSSSAIPNLLEPGKFSHCASTLTKLIRAGNLY